MIVPRLPRVLDADDRGELAGLVLKWGLYSVLVIWAAVVLAVAVRLFVAIALGG